jgi:asparagine synthase (glutamine-hydrolysing)
MRIELLNNAGKSWHSIGNSYVKGFAFIENKLLSEQDIFDELIQSIKKNSLNKTLLKFNGNFSAVIEYQKNIYLLADKLKTYPLLYAKINNEWIITDQSKVIIDAVPQYSPNESAIMTYLALGYLHGDQTFLNDCKIVSAGTYVQIHEEASVYQYHKHIYEKVILSEEDIMEVSVHNLENAIRRMLISIGDRPIWIPLSGGYDSRLLACVFKKLNLKNVSCYTYGIAESFEVRISKKVADKLGFPWYYVEYNEEKCLSILRDPIYDQYIFWAMNLNTTAHIQDFIAFKELREKGIIEDNAIIVPGHKVNIPEEDKLPYHLLNSNRSIAELLYHIYYTGNILKIRYKKRVLANLGFELNSTISKDNKVIAWDLINNWNIQNRQANYIVNSVRVYEYFGVDWRIPLWDDTYSKLWNTINWEINSNLKDYTKILYNKFMFDKYFIPNNIAFSKNIGAAKSLIAKIRLPFGIKDRIKTFTYRWKYFKGQYDFNGFSLTFKYYLEALRDFHKEYIAILKTSIDSLIPLYSIFLIEKYFGNKNN